MFQIKHSCVLNKTQLCFKNFSFVSTSFRHTPQGHPELTYKLQSSISAKKAYYARKEEHKRLTLCVKAALCRAWPSVTHFCASHRPSRSASRLTSWMSNWCESVTHAVQKNKLLCGENWISASSFYCRFFFFSHFVCFSPRLSVPLR